MSWLMENLATIIITVILFAVVINHFSFPTTGHSKGTIILICPVAFFYSAIVKLNVRTVSIL